MSTFNLSGGGTPIPFPLPDSNPGHIVQLTNNGPANLYYASKPMPSGELAPVQDIVGPAPRLGAGSVMTVTPSFQRELLNMAKLPPGASINLTVQANNKTGNPAFNFTAGVSGTDQAQLVVSLIS
jgi:hypothetical protein